MVAPTKPVPWNSIKSRYEAGEAENAIAEDLTARGNKISKQAIRKRRMREGWAVNPSAVKVKGAATAWERAELPPTATGNQRSEEHTSELQSLMRISYAVFCLKKKK